MFLEGLFAEAKGIASMDVKVGSPCLDCAANAVGENNEDGWWKVSCVAPGVRGGVVKDGCPDVFREFPGLPMVTVLGIAERPGELGSFCSDFTSLGGIEVAGAETGAGEGSE